MRFPPDPPATVAADPTPSHDTLSIESRALGERRRINVHVPTGYASRRGAAYPVLYMPDGGVDEDFSHVVNTVDSLVALRRIRPVIVVGIPNTQRRRDLTGPTRVREDSAIAPRVGGSAAFRRFIGDELIPVIERRYRTTRERGLVGESLAGLFVVETLLAQATRFDHYVAFDPSLWWDRGALVDSAASRLRDARLEGRSLDGAASADGIDDRMGRLADALRAVAPPGLNWHYVSRRDLTHATIFRGELPAALTWALR
jgi:predicted alpha/beta superfamily hydrolase